jgi:hypothetical protein
MSIRPAFGVWSLYNERLRDAVGAMSAERLSSRWP